MPLDTKLEDLPGEQRPHEPFKDLDKRLKTRVDRFTDARTRLEHRKERIRKLLNRKDDGLTALEKKVEQAYRDACKEVLPHALSRMRELGIGQLHLYRDMSSSSYATDQGTGWTTETHRDYTLDRTGRVTRTTTGNDSDQGKTGEERKGLAFAQFADELVYSYNPRSAFSDSYGPSTYSAESVYENLKEIAAARTVEDLKEFLA